MSYEEAISELNHELSVGNIGVITRDNIAKALTYAQKEHELLDLYRYVWKTPILSQTISYEEAINRIDELEEELK